MCAMRAAGGEAVAARPVLLIGIDAVPYRVVRDLRADDPGLFGGFTGPVPANSTFPSVSYTAWSELLAPLGSCKPLGFEPRYFDAGTRRLKGGLSLGEEPASWQRVFDWRLRGLWRTMLAYGWPRHYARVELRRGLEAFARSSQPLFSMYIMSTDGLAHLHGPESLAEVLRAIHAELAAFRRAHPEKAFHAVLLSDHGIAGGEPLVNQWPLAARAASRAGFKLRSHLGVDDRQVVFNPYGLLTGFVMYAHERQTETLAQVVAALPGVDLGVVHVGADAWRAFSSRGTALIERRAVDGKLQWRYRPESGDPLNYSVLAEGTSADAWQADDWWREQSREAPYPDALHRLAQSFELTATAPSVVCSCAPGAMFGALKTEYLARATIGRLRWSHGALHTDASTGFLMTDIPGWAPPAALRAEEALTSLVPAPAALSA